MTNPESDITPAGNDPVTDPGTSANPDFDKLLSDALTVTANNAASVESNARSDTSKPKALVPGIDAFLGHGYNVFGEFASPNSVRARIYDLSNETRVDQPTIDRSLSLDPEQISKAFNLPPEELKLVYARPVRVGYTEMFQATVDVRQIDTSDKQENSWGIGGTLEGGYGGFTGEISGRFDTNSTKLATTKCLQANCEMIYWKLDTNNYSYTNPPPIVEDVKEDFKNQSPDKLMAKYGTHCLEEIGIGTKIVHSYTIDTSKFSNSTDVTAALKAKYQGKGWSAGMEVDSKYHDAAWNDRGAVSVKIVTYGTSDEQLAEITDLSKGLGEHPLAVLKQGWHNPTLIKFYPSTLKPLWEVEGLMSPEKAKAFEDRFRERAKAEQGKLNMLFQGLRPLYLLSKTDKTSGRKRYRFDNTVHYKDAEGEWTIENDESPWLYTSAIQKEGMVPLYELALNSNTSIVRYETQNWIDEIGLFNRDNYNWKKTGRTLGYVYENKNNGAESPKGSDPAYCFYPSDLKPENGLFYSHLQELIWDGGNWKPLSEFHLIESALRLNGGYNPEVQPIPLIYWVGIPHWYAIQPG